MGRFVESNTVLLIRALWLTVIVLFPSHILADDIYPDSEAGEEIQKIFGKFRQKHPAYAKYEIILHKSYGKKVMVADKGDVDGDGNDEVIFGIHDTNVPPHTSNRDIEKRVVVLRGRPNGEFSPVLINQAIAEYGYGFDVGIRNFHFFFVSAYSGGYAHQLGPGSTRTVVFALQEERLPIDSLKYRSPWRVESASPENSYDYDFGTMLYREAWDVFYREKLPLHDTGGRMEVGMMEFKADVTAIHLTNNSNPFNWAGEHGVTPEIVVKNTVKVPDIEFSSYGPDDEAP